MKNKEFVPHPKQTRSDKKFKGMFKYQLDPTTGKFECIEEDIYSAPTQFWCDGCNMWLHIDFFRKLLIHPRKPHTRVWDPDKFIPDNIPAPEDDIHLCKNCYEWRFKPWLEEMSKKNENND